MSDRQAAPNRRRDAQDAENDRYCFRPRCRCPSCESTSVETTRTLQHDDECHSQRKRCRACGHRFIDIQE